MFSIKDIILGQFGQLALTLVIGFLLSLREIKFPARNNQGYRDHWVEVFALTILFIEATGFGLLIAFLKSFEFLRPLQMTIASFPWFVLIPTTSLLAELGNYSAHRVLHSRYFWRFHRWHHSPDYLFWYSGFRGSFVHIFFLGLTSIVLLTVSNLNPWVLGTLAIQGIGAQMLGHVNFDIRIPILSRIMVMPQYHRIHHAVSRDLHDSNFCFFWTIWDQVFQTQTKPESVPQDFPIGIPASEKAPMLKMLIG